LLRQDNADLRLTPYGYQLGLISEQRYKKFLKKKTLIEKEKERLKGAIIHTTQKVNELLNKLGTTPLSEATTLATLLTRPEVTYNQTTSIDPNRPELPAEVTEQVEIQIKYARKFGVEIEGLTINLEGDTVHGGWTDKEGRERRGFKQIRYEVKIKTNAPEEKIQQLHKLVEEKCSVSDMLINPTNVKGSVSIG